MKSIVSSLGLDYNGSDKHRTFLRSWFRNDQKIMEQLNFHRTGPIVGHIQVIYHELTITTRKDLIIVAYKAESIDSIEDTSHTWFDAITFKKDGNTMAITKREWQKKREWLQ